MWGGRRIPFACCLLPGALSLGLCGCLGRNHVDPDYRFRDAQMAELRDHLYSGKFAAADRHRQEAEKPDAVHRAAYREVPPTPAVHRLHLTAAASGEHRECLRVVLEPRDQFDKALRPKAALHLCISQDGPGAQTTFLGQWDLAPEILDGAWTSGWSEAGYRLVVPWKTWPTAEKVRVVARLTLADGTHLDAEQMVPLREGAVQQAGPDGQDGSAVRQAQALTQGAAVPVVEPADLRWQPTPLGDAVQLHAPVPLGPGE
jgi:hypothetical protein